MKHVKKYKYGLHLAVATHFAHQKFAREKRTQGCSKQNVQI